MALKKNSRRKKTISPRRTPKKTITRPVLVSLRQHPKRKARKSRRPSVRLVHSRASSIFI
jgi:hypothetical protein